MKKKKSELDKVLPVAETIASLKARAEKAERERNDMWVELEEMKALAIGGEGDTHWYYKDQYEIQEEELQGWRTKYYETLKDRDRLQHVIDCANTPLMADVLKERELLLTERNKMIDERDALRKTLNDIQQITDRWRDMELVYGSITRREICGEIYAILSNKGKV